MGKRNKWISVSEFCIIHLSKLSLHFKITKFDILPIQTSKLISSRTLVIQSYCHKRIKQW